jgi:hypothetical protein
MLDLVVRRLWICGAWPSGCPRVPLVDKVFMRKLPEVWPWSFQKEAWVLGSLPETCLWAVSGGSEMIRDVFAYLPNVSWGVDHMLCGYLS